MLLYLDHARAVEWQALQAVCWRKLDVFDSHLINAIGPKKSRAIERKLAKKLIRGSRKVIAMPDTPSGSSTRNSKFITASPETLYRAFTDPIALAAWRAPGDMTGEVHSFDGRVGGGYQMSLYYPASEETMRGKTSDREDRYSARFVELTPPRRIVEAIRFDTTEPGFAGEMTMEVALEAADGGTVVSIVFKNLPPGIRPADNEIGTLSALEKLARYVE